MIAECCKTYFCEGQKLTKSAAERLADEHAPWHIKHRKIVGLGLPLLLWHTIWWTYMAKGNTSYSFDAFTNKVGPNETPAWYMSVTMVFGSMLAGATSEGGAAVAFPIMTLVFDIAPAVARDFSYMIQSVGMTAAAFTILWMKVQVEWKSILYCTIGGTMGVIFGLEKVAPEMTPPYSKMYFVVIWGSFAGSLYWLNRLQGRKVYLVMDPPQIPQIWRSADLVPSVPALGYILNWKALVLIASGFMGGIFTAMSGSGIDICSFAVLTLLFRITEKTATPTSVVLMGINTVIAALYRQYGMEGLNPDSWDFLIVCVPVVVIGAPMGSVLGSFLHRLVLAAFVYITDTAQLVGALVVVRPWSNEKCHEGTDCTPMHLCWSSALLFFAGLVMFYILQYLGEKIIELNDNIEADAGVSSDNKAEKWTELASNKPYGDLDRSNADLVRSLSKEECAVSLVEGAGPSELASSDFETFV